MIIDTYRHKGLRRQLIESLRKKGITDERVLEAMEKIPRHAFFESSFLEFAYDDVPFPIGAGQTISQPYTVAYQTQLLNVEKNQKILEIGTGSGYQACILAEMGAKVYTIERIKELYLKTKKFLFENNFKPKIFYGDGYKGLPSFAPFDRILVTCAAPYIPEELKKQLKIGGRMVIPVNVKPDLQVMTTVDKISENEYDIKEHSYFRFVPMVEDKE